MPVALELPVIGAVGGVEQVEWLGVVVVRGHFRCQRLVDVEAVAVVEMRALDEAPDVVGIAPERDAIRAAVPQAPEDRSALRVAQQIGVAVAAVMLVLRMDVGGVEGQPHLLHPILGAEADLDALLQSQVDEVVGELLDPGVEPQAGSVGHDDVVDAGPEGVHLRGDQAGFVVHPELEGVDVGHAPEQLGQRRDRVVHQVLLSQTGDPPTEGVVGLGHAAGLHAAAIDMVPDAEGEIQPTCVCHRDEAVERVEAARLHFRREAGDFHAREARHVEEVGVGRCHITGALVSEEQGEGVEAVLRQHIQVARPVGLVEEAPFEIALVHRIDRERADPDLGRLLRLAELAQGMLRIRRPTNAIGHVEQGVHQPPVVPAPDEPGGYAAVGGLVDQYRLRRLGEGDICRCCQGPYRRGIR